VSGKSTASYNFSSFLICLPEPSGSRQPAEPFNSKAGKTWQRTAYWITTAIYHCQNPLLLITLCVSFTNSLKLCISQQTTCIICMSSCFILPFRHKSGCEVYVVHGILLLNGFHFFIKVRGSPLFHIALNPRTLRDLCAWNHKDILALKHKRYLARS
jgi:hypothetical protein